MKIIECEQGTAAWFSARKGVPTASCFDQIITPVKGEFSKSAAKYGYKLIAERLLNQSLDSLDVTEWMERGRELEPMAVKQFEFSEEVETVPVGFIISDDGLLGASPDRLIKGETRTLEIKCPSPSVHLGYLLDGHAVEYRPQVMGQLLVTELDTAIFYSYHPMMPARIIRTHRDEPYIAKMRDALSQFLALLADMEQRARSLGVFQALSEAKTPLEVERAGALHTELLDAFGIPP